MSVQLTIKIERNGVDFETTMFDINSIEIAETLEYISYDTYESDENGFHWFACEGNDFFDTIQSEIKNAEFKYGDYWDDLHKCGIFYNKCNLKYNECVKLFWKIS